MGLTGGQLYALPMIVIGVDRDRLLRDAAGSAYRGRAGGGRSRRRR